MSMVRLGGDEFLAVFQSGENGAGVSESLNQARARYEAACRQHGSLSFSIGGGLIGDKIEDALEELDQRMYEDKQRNNRAAK